MGFYLGPMSKQKNPRAINVHVPKPFPLKPAPIVSQNRTGVSFKGYGNNHFTYKHGEGYHATTQMPGFGKSEGLKKGLSIRTPRKGGF